MTQIWCADIIVNNQQYEKLKSVSCKKLPVHILLSDEDFIYRIKRDIGDKRWKSLPLNKITQLPDIKINFIKYLSDVNYD